jgi:hypothetical protein
VSPVKYELGFYIPEDDIPHCHCREDLKSYMVPHKAAIGSWSHIWRYHADPILRISGKYERQEQDNKADKESATRKQQETQKRERATINFMFN